MLDTLFNPKTIAVIGASNTPGKVGYAIVKNLIEADYSGEIFPINLEEKEIQSIKSYKSVSAVEKQIDLAVICVPAKVTPLVLGECAKKGIKNAVIITAGFSETGEQGKKLEEQLNQIILENKMNVVGPNTLGIINTEIGLNASFAATYPQRGKVAVVSQSGALCTAVLDWARQEKIGFSKFISTGNKTYLDETEYFDYLEHDPNTKAVLVYMESVKDSKGFLRQAAKLSKNKVVVLLKAGRSKEGQKAASSHTGAMSVDDKIFSIACKKSNIIRMNSIEGFLDIAKLISKINRVKGFNLAVITNAGGPGVITADSASAHHFPLPDFSAKTLATMNSINPYAANPLDLIGDAKPIDYKTALKTIQDDEGIDLIYCILTPQSMTNPERVADIIVSLNKRKPILCSFIGGTAVSHSKRYLKEHGVVEFETPERGIKALARLKEYCERKKMKKSFEQKVTPSKDIKKMLTGKNQLSLGESFKLLKSFGVLTPNTSFFATIDELHKMLEKVKFPVALKTASGLAHKTDFGLVKANIPNEKELIVEAEKMFVKSKELKISPVLALQEMIDGQELLISAITTEFGKTVTYGLGGIFVEVMKDYSQKIAPVTDSDIEEMLNEVKGTKVLLGARTKKKYNIGSLKRMLKTISTIALTYPAIKEIEMNPVIINEKGCYAVDAVITL